MPKRAVDVIVQIPLEEEYLEFVSLFPTGENVSWGANLAYYVTAPSDLQVIVVLQDNMGRKSADETCAGMLEAYCCRLYVCLGIAGGLSSDLSLGDVCYTGGLVDVYDNSKIYDAEGGGLDLEFAPEFYATNTQLTAALGFIRTATELKGLLEYWTEDQSSFVDNLKLPQIEARQGVFEEISRPKCLNGWIVCGAVSESHRYREKLKGVTRKILAVETESGAIFSRCAAKGIPALTVRGISDYADETKNKLAPDIRRDIRRIAARNAASFLNMQMQSPIFLAALSRPSGGSDDAPELPIEPSPKDTLPATLERIAGEIDRKLRELSPQFKLKPVGYRLPTPRVRPVDQVGPPDAAARSPSIELADAIQHHRKMLINVPRTYPDPALAWVIANALLLADIGDKKAVPIVIDGERIGPPSSGMASLSSVPLTPQLSAQGAEFVFIVDSPPMGSKTKTNHLIADSKCWPDARFLFITREEKSMIQDADFVRQVGAESFDLCQVSFYEMAVFLESAFDMPSVEAEVVALKLKQIFNKFSLPAHPSFFAGIPLETISAILVANRRSELIQLAVDGFLTFVVAADKDPIRMSRTNRAQFMRRLVVELAVEKRSFTQAGLVAFAQEISDEYDYGLNALLFVESFVEQGILHFDDGRVKVTLPFIESYLLAYELSRRPDLAVRYFNLSSDDMDFLTFDLYCEIGPSPEFIDHVKVNLKSSIDDSRGIADQHILLTGEISPTLFKHPERFVALSKRVSLAKEAVATDATDKAEKAKLLDIADRLNEDLAARLDSQDLGDAETPEYVALNELLKAWTGAAVMLGSGAESIKGPERQEMAELLLHGMDAALHQWTKLYASIDFEDIRREVLEDQEFRASVDVMDDKEFEKTVSSLTDFVEYLALSEPLNRLLEFLFDQARHGIIGQSLSKTSTSTKIGALIRGLWLTDINQRLGRGELSKAIAALPDARFLRGAVTSLIVQRVKWSLSDKPTRLALLDAAEFLVRPINPNLDKGELIRFVEHNDNRQDDERPSLS